MRLGVLAVQAQSALDLGDITLQQRAPGAAD
jgi:hypothetical protein